jgi:predicted RNA-binding Zn-ribbon protein involved in translation (DUF1610 family)
MSGEELAESQYAKCPQCDNYLIAEARSSYELGKGWCQYCGWEQTIGLGDPPGPLHLDIS